MQLLGIYLLDISYLNTKYKNILIPKCIEICITHQFVASVAGWVLYCKAHADASPSCCGI